jgi:endonuclease/exonuclease/phosphatase family metal-dependent hydrolase
MAAGAPSAFEVPPHEQIESWLPALGDRDAHHAIAAQLPCLWQADVEPASVQREAGEWLRVAVWNLERGRRPLDAAELIRRTGADAALLSEADSGMARTDNRDVTRDIASALGFGCAFGVEFVELGLGDEREVAAHAGQRNDRGLHGNAILSAMPLADPQVVRLDSGGDWFRADRGQPRVGSRVAVMGGVELAGTDVLLVSVHLESQSDGAYRAGQMQRLLDAIDARTKEAAVIGGDLNTFGADLRDLANGSAVRRLRRAEPARFSWPVAHEPLFEAAGRHGFEWVDANLAAPTTRHGAGGLPSHHPMKLDWILVRGLDARRAAVVAACDGQGAALSDHELLAVSVRPRD